MHCDLSIYLGCFQLQDSATDSFERSVQQSILNISCGLRYQCYLPGQPGLLSRIYFSLLNKC